MTDRDGWTAAQKLLKDVAKSVREQDARRILQDFDELIPFNRCLVWRWRAMQGELTDSQDLDCFSVIPDVTASFEVEPVRDPDQKAMDADYLFGAYSTFLIEEVGERSEAPAFKVYSGNQDLKGFCYNPDGQGGYFALVAQLDTEDPIESPERVRLFECSLPVLSALFEGWRIGEKHREPALKGGTMTPRQRAILSLLMEGKSTARIAHSLSVSERTVSWHLHNIYRKLEVRSRQEAIVTVKKLNILTDE